MLTYGTSYRLGHRDPRQVWHFWHSTWKILNQKEKGGGGGGEMEWVVPFKAKNAVLHRIQKYFPVDS